LLAPIYGWFTEGFDTADLKDAKALLDEPTGCGSFLDMPGGLELLRVIKERCPEVPVMTVTAYDDDERRRQAGRGGAHSRDGSSPSGFFGRSQPELACARINPRRSWRR
jgi:hypothetical protein